MSFIEVVREPASRKILGYWLRYRRARNVPTWHCISPADISPQILPHLFLYACEGKGRFRCKLMGTELCRVLGANETGRCLDASRTPNAARHRADLFRHVLDTSLPLYYRGLEPTKPGETRRISRLLLPVASSGRSVDLVFGMAVFGAVEVQASAEYARSDRVVVTQIVCAAEAGIDLPGRKAPLLPERPRRDSHGAGQ